MESAVAFESQHCALPELRSEVWEGFVFVSLDASPAPLAPRLVTLARVLARYRFDEFVTLEPMVFESAFNWKMLVDNFMEAYHHIATHRDTLEPALPGRASYALESDGLWSLLVMPPRGAKASDDPIDWPDESLVAGCVFPSHLFALSPGLLTWYQILPTAAGRFKLCIHTCPSRESEGASHAEALNAITRKVHLQDVAACESAWAGLQSPCYRSGFITPLEKPLWQFSQWWLDRMGL